MYKVFDNIVKEEIKAYDLDVLKEVIDEKIHNDYEGMNIRFKKLNDTEWEMYENK